MYSDAQVLRLLNHLGFGFSHPMDSVGDWADRLADDPLDALAARFVNQLADEWFDADPPDTLCEELVVQVRQQIARHPGWPPLWAHTVRVMGVMLALAEEAGVDPVLAYLAGLYHDIAKLDEELSSEGHEDLGAAMAGRALRGKLHPVHIETIQEAIRKTGDDPLTNVLHNADKLDKLGASGVVRRVSSEPDRRWWTDALWRVSDAARYFPVMHFDLSQDLAASKRMFQAWFVPLAESALGE
ncbi:MAG: HD domain-containing protein [Anaerolineae bacterium]|nr:HD domain-containing protein [Anaerolineae bacterium]